MPGNKCWHFVVKEEAILIFCDGKEVVIKKNRDSVSLGPVKEIYYGAENPQAKTFKVHAVEISAYMAE